MNEQQRLRNIANADQYHASPAYELDLADEMGFSRDAAGVAAYQAWRAEQDAEDARRATPEHQAAENAASKEILRQMRREVGLPDGVAPDAPLIRINGSVAVIINGEPWFGAFTVDAQNRICKPRE